MFAILLIIRNVLLDIKMAVSDAVGTEGRYSCLRLENITETDMNIYLL